MGTPTAYHKRKGNPWPDVATMLHACRSAVHHLPLPGISLVVSILSDLVGKVQAAKSNEQVAKDLGEDIRQLLEAIDTTAKKVQTDLDRFASASEDRSRMEQALRSASPLHASW
ncbi:hypothetical protein C8Q79DRAFT_141652 [Trametes meyenii]|nr:hypothetical protein C8Q79DRAFT_141652 [Trametes meyenii]